MAAGASSSDESGTGSQERHEPPPSSPPTKQRHVDDDELPVWTATPAAAATNASPALFGSEPNPFVPEPEAAQLPVAPPPARRGRRRLAVGVALAAAAVASVGGLAGWLIGRSQAPSQVEAAEVSTEARDTQPPDGDDIGLQSEAPSGEGAPADGSTSTTAPVGRDTGITQTSSATEAAAFVVVPTADNPSGATQYAVMAGGKAIMRGWYPTAEHAKQAVDDATVIMGGPDNVVDETLVDPSAAIEPDSFAVYFQDYVLFESDSATITPEFFEFLSYPLFFMQQSEQATVTVVARTDAAGSVAYNQELSNRRAEAVRDHWLANGGDASQIILDPRGEEEAEEGADEEQARQDRRVELIVSGFLSSD